MEAGNLEKWWLEYSTCQDASKKLELYRHYHKAYVQFSLSVSQYIDTLCGESCGIDGFCVHHDIPWNVATVVFGPQICDFRPEFPPDQSADVLAGNVNGTPLTNTRTVQLEEEGAICQADAYCC